MRHSMKQQTGAEHPVVACKPSTIVSRPLCFGEKRMAECGDCRHFKPLGDGHFGSCQDFDGYLVVPHNDGPCFVFWEKNKEKT